MREEKLRAEGLAETDARTQARGRFGGVTPIRERCRDLWTFRAVETLWQDVRYGARVLRNSPVFTAMAVISLALGIGANSAVFTLVDALLLQNLPVESPEQLTIIHYAADKTPRVSQRGSEGGFDEKTGRRHLNVFSYPAYQRLRDEAETLSTVFAFARLRDVNLSADGNSRIAQGLLSSGNYFAGLGVQAALGRLIEREDDRPNSEPVAVISFSLWERVFGGDEAVVGKEVAINGAPFTIIGVMPPQFFGVSPGVVLDIAVPLAAHTMVVPRWAQPDKPLYLAHDIWWLNLMGRLNPGVTMDQAQAELDVIYSQMLEAGKIELREGATRPEMFLLPGRQGLDSLRRRYSRPLWTLFIVVGSVLLIACINLANLLLTRAQTRRKEINLRLTLGAGRRRLIRQLLTESLLLSLLGGTVGIALAHWGSRALLAMVAVTPDATRVSAWPDSRILGFTVGVTLLTGLLFGLAPAMRASRVNPAPALKEGTAAGWASGRTPRFALLSRGLIVLQVALSLMLVAGAGLFLRSLQNLRNIELGFRTERLLVFGLDPTLSGYGEGRLLNYYREVFRTLESVPGSVGVTACSNRLLRGWTSGSIIDITDGGPKDRKVRVAINHVGPRFFETMGIPITMGRGPTERDHIQAPRVAFINEALARRFGDGSPLGRTFRWSGVDDLPAISIAGVVENAKYDQLRDNIGPTIYVPYEQARWGVGSLDLAVRTSGEPLALVDSVRSALRRIDPGIPMMAVTTQERQIEDRLRTERLFANLSTGFGMLALLLACIGIYGVMAYSVARRTGEIGIRMALGAQHSDVAWLVLRQMLVLLALGTAAGLAGALATTQLVSSMLYGIEANDPVTFAVAAAVMLAVALTAGYLPGPKGGATQSG